MADEFEKDLLAEFDRAIATVEKGIAEAVVEGLQRAVEMSPIDTGFFASNHRIALNATDVDLVPAERPKPVGKPVLNANPQEIAKRESAKLESFKLGDTIIIGNAVPYAGHVDRASLTYERTGDSIFARIERKFK